MSLPEAYAFFQDFAPEPTRTFQVDRHYLLYASKGAMRLEAEGRAWSLPPARAALIAAGKPIEITIAQPMTVCSVLFDPGFTSTPPAALTVFEMTSLAREMILECRQWGPDDGPLSDYARQMFTTLSAVTWRLAESPSPAVMPVGRSPAVRRALELTENRIAEETSFVDIADAVAATPRSLSRHLADEIGMTWRQALRRIRMIRAIEALSATPAPVTEVAMAVGYGSLSAFNAAFRDFTGMTPTDYRASFHIPGNEFRRMAFCSRRDGHRRP
jgi:AraC-like DNA-binding protein